MIKANVMIYRLPYAEHDEDSINKNCRAHQREFLF